MCTMLSVVGPRAPHPAGAPLPEPPWLGTARRHDCGRVVADRMRPAACADGRPDVNGRRYARRARTSVSAGDARARLPRVFAELSRTDGAARREGVPLSRTGRSRDRRVVHLQKRSPGRFIPGRTLRFGAGIGMSSGVERLHAGATPHAAPRARQRATFIHVLSFRLPHAPWVVFGFRIKEKGPGRVPRASYGAAVAQGESTNRPPHRGSPADSGHGAPCIHRGTHRGRIHRVGRSARGSVCCSTACSSAFVIRARSATGPNNL